MNAENKISAAAFIKTAALLLFFGTLLFSCEKVYIIEVEKPSVEQQNDSTEAKDSVTLDITLQGATWAGEITI